MMKHLIEFEGKKIALDRNEILSLFGQLEPYFAGFAMGLNDFDMQGWVTQYRKDVRESRQMVKQNRPIKPEKPEKPVYYEDNVYSLSDYREERKSSG